MVRINLSDNMFVNIEQKNLLIRLELNTNNLLKEQIEVFVVSFNGFKVALLSVL